MNKKPRQSTQALVDAGEDEEEAAQDEDDTWEVAGRGKNKSHRRPVVHQAPPTPTHVTEALEDLKVEDNVAEAASSSDAVENATGAAATSEDIDIQIGDDDDEDSDAGEWITPENVVQVKAAELGHKSEGKASKFQVMQVACITADFAMQVR